MEKIKVEGHKVTVSRFGKRRLYLDENTRIEYSNYCGRKNKTYQLQRKQGFFWIEKAWIFAKCFKETDTIDDVVEWLLWSENKQTIENAKKHPCKF
jgi:hypothetical protein